MTLLAFAAFADTAGAAAFVVPDDAPTIEEAVDEAGPGDIVLVRQGSWEGNLRITKPLTLKAPMGPDVTTISAADPSLPVIEVVGVEGFTVTGFTLTGSESAGLVVRDSRDGIVSYNHAVENRNGIMVYSARDVHLMLNNADSNTIYGIYLESTFSSRLTENTANRNKDRGILLNYSDDNLLKGNSANLNTWNGITLWESNDNVLRDNLTLRNTYGVVIGNSTGNVQEGNKTLPNIYIILPIVLLYLGILSYIIQKNVLKLLYRE